MAAQELFQEARRLRYTGPLTVTNPNAAGIDIHLATHWVAVPPQSAPPPPANHPANLPPWVRPFGTCTGDLEMLADWPQAVRRQHRRHGGHWHLLGHHLRTPRTSRLPESTSSIPTNPNMLQDDPKPMSSIVQWIQRLHSYGLLHSLVPARRSGRPSYAAISANDRCSSPTADNTSNTCKRPSSYSTSNSPPSSLTSPALPAWPSSTPSSSPANAILWCLAQLRNERCHTLRRGDRPEHSMATGGKSTLFELQQALELYLLYQRQLQACSLRLGQTPRHHLLRSQRRRDLASQATKTQTRQQRPTLRRATEALRDVQASI